MVAALTERFAGLRTQVVQIGDIRPRWTEKRPKTGVARRAISDIEIGDREYRVTGRFMQSLAARFHVGQEFFRYFTPSEVFARVQETHPHSLVRLTTDGNAALGMSNPDRPIVHPQELCRLLESQNGRVVQKQYAEGITLARTFSGDDLYHFRKWLADKEYAPKTIDAVLVLTKQAFKWAWRQEHLRDYRLASVTLPKAKARPQPCFTSEQVDQLTVKAVGEEKGAFALMGYAGLRIGEVEQLRWEDLREQGADLTMIHVRRGGSAGTTKDKDERFVPVHPKIAPHLSPRKKSGPVFSAVAERTLLARLKDLCAECKFEAPDQYKLHSFRHHFASLCANHHVAYRKALAWLGHSSSDMLDLYYHLHDEDSQEAMRALAGAAAPVAVDAQQDSPPKGNLRATGESRIEKTPQTPELQELVACVSDRTERGGFEPPVQTSRTQPFQGCPISHSGTSPSC